MSNTAWCKKIQTAAWRCQQNMNKVLHTYTYVNKLWSKTQNWFIQYNYLFYFKKYKDNSFSKFFMLIQTNSKKTIAISKAISTFIVFPSMYFPSLFVLRETSTSNSPQLACAHSVKAIQSVAMSFSVNLWSLFCGCAWSANCNSPKKIKGTQLITPF